MRTYRGRSPQRSRSPACGQRGTCCRCAAPWLWRQLWAQPRRWRRSRESAEADGACHAGIEWIQFDAPGRFGVRARVDRSGGDWGFLLSFLFPFRAAGVLIFSNTAPAAWLKGEIAEKSRCRTVRWLTEWRRGLVPLVFLLVSLSPPSVYPTIPIPVTLTSFPSVSVHRAKGLFRCTQLKFIAS